LFGCLVVCLFGCLVVWLVVCLVAVSHSLGESTIADIDNLAQLVIDQTSCSKAAAIKALNETNGDVVSAIMKVTSI
jgi:hypothetical protein